MVGGGGGRAVVVVVVVMMVEVVLTHQMLWVEIVGLGMMAIRCPLKVL